MCHIVMYLGVFMISCGKPAQQVNDLSAYYFPIDAFPAQGMLYTYHNLVDTSAEREVWRHIKKADGLLESINYNSDQEVVQKQYDRIVTNGVITDSLLLFFEDSMGLTQYRQVNMISPHRFPFDPGDSSKVWLTHLEWWQPEDSLHVVLQRRRRFAGPTIWNDHGKSVPAVKFRTEDRFETERDGWTTTEWTGEEIYALHIGLVYYRRDISDQLKLEFELESRK
jgi:hypothetical protein